MEPKGKTAWITGASSGIGEGLAYAMAKAGAKLILSARSADKLEEVKRKCAGLGATAAVLQLDMSDHESFPEKVKEAESFCGPIDILVNNAGIGQRGSAVETIPEVDKRIMDVNFFGPIFLTKAVLPSMIERKSGQIVITSSVFGKFGGPTRTAYAASKHAVQGWFDCLRSEVHKDGITVTVICPGYIRTNISLHALEADGSSHNKLDKGQLKGMTPDECAAKMMKVIRKNKSEAYVGGFVEVGAVYLKRFLPGLFERIIRNVKVN
ncbi:MAG: SDR family oxidoreductase [Planctomycetes bacterium]|nr:SDR family oxidoreductase [Planctomycetota bacterium]